MPPEFIVGKYGTVAKLSQTIAITDSKELKQDVPVLLTSTY